MLLNNNMIGLIYAFTVLVALFSNNVYHSSKNSPFFVVVKELFELSVLSSLYLNMRPRIWPQFFTLELYEE